MIEHKTFQTQYRETGEPGEFVAVFSTLNVKDHQGDVLLPGAFTDGAPVRISAWGHNWSVPAVGKGVINADDNEARVMGRFFLDSANGREHYQVAKNLGTLQEWSYSLQDIEGYPGKFKGEDVRFIKSVTVPECCQVMLAASLNTRTEFIKGRRVGRGQSVQDVQARIELLELESQALELHGKDYDAQRASRPMTRAGMWLAQYMANEEVTQPFAEEMLKIIIATQAQQWLEREPWRFDMGSGFPCAGLARAQAAVSLWWAQPV